MLVALALGGASVLAISRRWKLGSGTLAIVADLLIRDAPKRAWIEDKLNELRKLEEYAFDFYATDLPLRDTKSELVTMTSADNIALLIAGSKNHSLLIASPRRWEEGITKSEKLVTENLGEQRFIGRCSPDCDWVLLRARRKE